MKKTFIFILLLFVPYYSFANMCPCSEWIGSWWFTLLPNSKLKKYVSVEKEILLFKTSNKNIYKNNSQYLWYDYIINKENITSEFIEKNTITSDNFWDIKTDKNIAIIEPLEEFYQTWSVDIAVRYYLKNNTDEKIENEKIWFSYRKVNFIQQNLFVGNLSEKIYVLNNENNYPTNFVAFDWKNKLDIKDEYVSEKFDNIYYTGYLREENKKHKELISVNKISTFNISFKPNETKILTIVYSLPFKIQFNWPKYIDYDFSPIFNWKDWTVKQLFIAILWDDNNILYSNYTKIDESIIKEHKVIEKSKYNFNRVWNNKYIKYIENITQDSNINDIKISFSNQKNIVDIGFWPFAINSEIFNTEIWNNEYLYETIKDILNMENKQKILINFKDWKKKVYDIFELLK